MNLTARMALFRRCMSSCAGATWGGRHSGCSAPREHHCEGQPQNAHDPGDGGLRPFEVTATDWRGETLARANPSSNGLCGECEHHIVLIAADMHRKGGATQTAHRAISSMSSCSVRWQRIAAPFDRDRMGVRSTSQRPRMRTAHRSKKLQVSPLAARSIAADASFSTVSPMLSSQPCRSSGTEETRRSE